MDGGSRIQNTQTAAVPLLDLKAQYAGLEEEIMGALRKVCASQHFILGAHVDELEKRVAEYSQCRFGIGVSSGTDALLVALMALDVQLGDEVITSPYTFFATAGAIARLGARPLFCDVDPDTCNLSVESVENLLRRVGMRSRGQLINRQTGGAIKVLMPVHLFGQMADMEPMMELARTYGLRVVEDAAQAIGSENARGRRAGALGDIGCFSFFPSKNLGAFGDGGMCTTNDPTLAERLKLLRAHGANPKYHHAAIGGNFRLDELQAAILLVKLKYLDQWTKQRQENASFYNTAFAHPELSKYITTPKVTQGYRHIYNQYVVRAERRDELKKHLATAQVGTEVYYPVPLHSQKCFSYLRYGPADFPESTRAAQDTLAIPIYPELTDVQKQHVVNSISDFYHENP